MNASIAMVGLLAVTIWPAVFVLLMAERCAWSMRTPAERKRIPDCSPAAWAVPAWIAVELVLLALSWWLGAFERPVR